MSEEELTDTLLQSPHVQLTLLREIGLVNEGICFIMRQIDTEYIFPGFKGKPGNLDLVVGDFSGRELKLDTLTGVEVKFWNFKKEPIDSENLPSKSSGICQAQGLIDLGFPKVYLVYVVCKPPPSRWMNVPRAFLKAIDFQDASKRVMNRPRHGLTIEKTIWRRGFGFFILEWGQIPWERPQLAGGTGIVYPKKLGTNIISMKPEYVQALKSTLVNAVNRADPSCRRPLILKHCKKCRNIYVDCSLLMFEPISDYCTDCYKN